MTMNTLKIDAVDPICSMKVNPATTAPAANNSKETPAVLVQRPLKNWSRE